MSTDDRPIRTQLVDLIRHGGDPVTATRSVLAPYGDNPLTKEVWAYILRLAREVEGQLTRRVRKEAMSSESGASRAVIARAALPKTVYRLPDGTRVLWDDLTMEEIDRKIAWMRVQLGSLMDHLNVLEEARKLMADRGVSRLGEVPGWVELISSVVNVDGAGSKVA